MGTWWKLRCHTKEKKCARDPLPTFQGLAAVREFVKKLAASAAFRNYVKFQAMIKSAASAASLRGGRASGRLDHGLFLQFLAAQAANKKSKKLNEKFAFWCLLYRDSYRL